MINALLDFPKTRTRCSKQDNSSMYHCPDLVLTIKLIDIAIGQTIKTKWGVIIICHIFHVTFVNESLII